MASLSFEGETHAEIVLKVKRWLQSVERGQIEAGMSLGLNRWHCFRLITFPQAFRTIFPEGAGYEHDRLERWTTRDETRGRGPGHSMAEIAVSPSLEKSRSSL